MSPAHFSEALQTLIAATRAIVLLPLEDMAAYVDQVETLGEGLMTDPQADSATQVGRMVSAAIHLRETTALGGVR